MMTGCSGCGKTLGFKKFKFHRMWRIQGYYCKECMLKLGKEFDDHGRITLQQTRCDLCHVGFYFLKSAWQGKKQGHYCDVCHQAITSGVIPEKSSAQQLKAPPQKLPQVMMIFAGLGVLMMALGLVFTLMIAPGSESSLTNILFGSVTTALGFVLFKKTVRSRSLIMGRVKAQEPTR